MSNSGKSVLRSPLLWLMVVGVLVALAMMQMGYHSNNGDTPSYMQAWERLRHGQIDAWRTPLYPLVLGLMQSLLGEVQIVDVLDWSHCSYLGPIDRVFTGVMVLQMLLALAVTPPFYGLLKRLTRSRWLSAIGAAVVLLPPMVMGMHNAILTESLSLSLTIVLLDALDRLYRHRSWLWAVVACLMTLALVALRPAFIFLVPVVLVLGAWLLCRQPWRKCGVTLLVGAVLIGIGLLAYCRDVERQQGVFTPSIISVINQVNDAQLRGQVDTTAITDPALLASLRQGITDAADLSVLHGAAALQSMTAQDTGLSYRLTTLWKHLVFAVTYPLTPPTFQYPQLPKRISYATMKLIGWQVRLELIVLALALVWLVRAWRRGDKALLWTLTVLAGYLGCNDLVALMGAQEGYGRLMLASYPAWVALVGMMVVAARRRYRLDFSQLPSFRACRISLPHVIVVAAVLAAVMLLVHWHSGGAHTAGFALEYALLLAATAAIYHTVHILTHAPRLALVGAVLYALPLLLAPQGPAVSLVALLLDALVWLRYSRAWWAVVDVVVILAALVWLMPALVVLVPVVVVMCLWLMLRHRQCRALAVVTAIGALLVTPLVPWQSLRTDVVAGNYVTMRRYGFIDPARATMPELRQSLQAAIDTAGFYSEYGEQEIPRLLATHDEAVVAQSVRRCTTPVHCAFAALFQLSDASRQVMIPSAADELQVVIGYQVRLQWIAALLAVVVMFIAWRRRARLPWWALTLAVALIAATTLMAIPLIHDQQRALLVTQLAPFLVLALYLITLVKRDDA